MCFQTKESAIKSSSCNSGHGPTKHTFQTLRSKIHPACFATSKHQWMERKDLSLPSLALHRPKCGHYDPNFYKWPLIWGPHLRHYRHNAGTQGLDSFGVVMEASQPASAGLHSKTFTLLLCLQFSYTPGVHLRMTPVTLCLRSLTLSFTRDHICPSKSRAGSRLVSGTGQTKQRYSRAVIEMKLLSFAKAIPEADP